MSDVALPAEFTELSLCSGYGGLSLAVGIAVPGARVVCHVEREVFVAAVLAARMEAGAMDAAPIWSDLCTFDGNPWCGRVDLVTAGFPCAPWSVAGKRAGTQDDRWIWPDIVRIIREVGPRFVFLENVRGLVSGGGLRPVLGDLADLGFDAEWCCVSASDVGAPHQRERIFILAHSPRHGRDRSGREERRGRRVCEAGDAMAHPEHAGPSPGRTSLGSRAEAGGASRSIAPMADTASLGEREPHNEQCAVARGISREDFGRRGVRHNEDLGHADGEGRREAISGEAQGRRSFNAERDMGHAECSRSQGDGPAESQRWREPLASGRNWRDEPFPPGPGNRDAWSAILAERPDLAPAVKGAAQPGVCHLDDEPAGRVAATRTHELRAGGNGVVPLQAAAALVTLAQRAGWALE